MTKKDMIELFGEDLEFLKTNKNLKNLLDNLCPDIAKYLIQKANKQTFLRILENDKTLSNQARLRSAYLYVYLSKNSLKLNFDIEEFRNQFSFYHGNRCEDSDGYARMFGLKNGLDNLRFNQFKNTGGF